MFSKRLSWDTQPSRIWRAIDDRRRSGARLYDLTESNPTKAKLALNPATIELILRALPDPRGLTYAPEPAGLLSTRTAVAAELGVPPDTLLLTSSTSEAYSFLFKLLADPGDEVLIPYPSYPLFEYLAGLESVSVRSYPLRYHEGWWADTLELSRRIGPRSRAIVLVNPNNPTGSYLKDEELDRISGLCAEHGLALISDEVFFSYRLKADMSRRSTSTIQNVLTFTLGGLSKLLALPQMKLGWIHISGPQDQAAAARSALELIADSYLSVSAPVQHAVPNWLSLTSEIQGVILERLRGNLSRLSAVSNVLDLEGGWYATIPLSRERSEEEWVLQLLSDYDVVIQPGFFFDFDFGPVGVLSLLTEPECFAEGVARMAGSGCLTR